MMFIDMPPGTGDVPLTVFQSIKVDGIVIVTSPQELVSMIVEKAVHMADMMKVPVLGIVENMSYFECPDCGKKHNIYGESHVDEAAVKFGIDAVAKMPMRIPLNGNFIAALLTILGYSINDTVVIYDRVRENRQLYGNSMDFATLVNNSINQSLRRSINTTISTLLALGTVCVVSVVFGLDSIFTFAFPLIIGMISGVYSTICIAGPLWVEWELHKKAKPRKKKA